MPEVRKEIFLVTKDHPTHPAAADRDARRAARRPRDRLRRPVLHPRPRRPPHRARASTGPRARSSRRRPRRSGSRARRSSSASRPTTPRQAEILQAAAEGGFVDAIMLQYTPWLDKDAPLNKALDACHKTGIGLISMKQVAGQSRQDPRRGRPSSVPDADGEGADALPGPAARDLDRRADLARSCVSMRNTDQIRENTDAAAPLRAAEARPRSTSSATPASPPARPSAPTATAAAPRRRHRRPSSAT